ncbi:MAG: hypothetical protein HGA39_03665 [Coriobacteriia bacterium]|nr:hypothetical protein [Coriobacteriia bacterium]
MRKFMFGLTINIFVSFFISIVVSIAIPIVMASPISMAILQTAVPWGTLIGTAFATIFAIGPISEKFSASIGAKRGTADWLLTRNMPIITIMLVVMSFFIWGIMTGFGDAMGMAFVDRWLRPIPALWPIAYVMSVLLDPICVWLAIKLVGAPGPAPAMAPEA